MAFQNTTARETCDTFSSGISFITTFGHHFSNLLADDIVMGEKLPEKNSEQMVCETEVRRNERRCSYGDQFVPANTTGITCVTTRTDDVPTSSRVGILHIPINQIQIRSSLNSAVGPNNYALNRNISNAFSDFPRDTNREAVRVIELIETDHIPVEIARQEISHVEHVQARLESRASNQIGNYMGFRHHESNVDNTNMNLSKARRKEELKSLKKQDIDGTQKNKERKRKYKERSSSSEEQGTSNTHPVDCVSPNVPGPQSSSPSKPSKSKKRKTKDPNLQVLRGPKTGVKSPVKTRKNNLKRLEEINERWRRKREKLIREESLEFSSPSKMLQKQESNSLNSTGKGMECSNVFDEMRPMRFNADVYFEDFLPKTNNISSFKNENEMTKVLNGKRESPKGNRVKVIPENSFNFCTLRISSDRMKSNSLNRANVRMENSTATSNKNQMNSQSTSSDTYRLLSSRMPPIFACPPFYVDAAKLKKHLKEKNKRCWKNRDKVLRKNSLKYHTLVMLIEKLKTNSFNRVDRVMGCSGATTNENINSQSTSSDSYMHFNVSSSNSANSSVRMNDNSSFVNSVFNSVQSNFSRGRSIVKSVVKSCRENLLKNYKGFSPEIAHENIPMKLNMNVLDLTEYNTSNEQRNSENLTAETYWSIVQPGTNSSPNFNDKPREADMFSNPENTLKLEEDRQYSDYTGENSQNDIRDSSVINHLSSSSVNLNIEDTTSNNMETCCNDDSDEYVDASESLEPNIETLSVKFSDMGVKIDHNFSNSRFEDTKEDIKMAEIHQNPHTKNYTLAEFWSHSISNAASNIKQVLLKQLESVNLEPILQPTQNFSDKNTKSGDVFKYIKDDNGLDKENILPNN